MRDLGRNDGLRGAVSAAIAPLVWLRRGREVYRLRLGRLTGEDFPYQAATAHSISLW